MHYFNCFILFVCQVNTIHKLQKGYRVSISASAAISASARASAALPSASALAGEGGDHKAHHHAAAAQDAVSDQLERHHKIERRQDAQEQHTGVDGRTLRVIHEQQQQEAAEEEVQEHDGHADDPHQIAA